jgi:hypothetical protein
MSFKSELFTSKSDSMIQRFFFHSYDEFGNVFGSMEMKPPNPTKLQWEFNSELVQKIDESYNDALKIAKVQSKVEKQLDKLISHKTFTDCGS